MLRFFKMRYELNRCDGYPRWPALVEAFIWTWKWRCWWGLSWD